MSGRTLLVRSLIGAAALVAVGAIAMSVLNRGAKSEAEPASAETTIHRNAVPVSVRVVTTGRAEATVRAWGAVEARREAEILAGVPGRVDAVHAALGDRVRRGDALVEVDAAFYRAALDEATALETSAEKTLEKAKRDLERNEDLFKTGIVSDSEIEGFRNAHLGAVAAHAQAVANLERARRDWTNARLTAPFDGQVALRPPDPGSSVAIGMPLTRVVDLDKVRVHAQVSEQDLARIHTGMPATIAVDALPGESFAGIVTAVGPQADAASRQFPVDIEVANPPALPLKAGMVARVEFVVDVLEDAPLLPVDALIDDGNRIGFYAVENGVARWRPATLGPRLADAVALTSGGAAGDSAVVLGQSRLADGARVTVEEPR